MRKNIFMVAIATLVVCSCGSSKKIDSSTSSYTEMLEPSSPKRKSRSLAFPR